MTDLPARHEGGSFVNAPYFVVPDNIKGGWNVYDTSQPNEPQRHFESRENAITYAEEISARNQVGFVVEEHEAPAMGKEGI